MKDLLSPRLTRLLPVLALGLRMLCAPSGAVADPAPSSLPAAKLSPQLSAALALVIRRHEVAYERWQQETFVKEDEIRAIQNIESEFHRLLSLAPDDPDVGNAVKKFYKAWCHELPLAPAGLATAVRRSSSPTRLALWLTDGDGCFELKEPVMLAALSVQPDQGALWSRAAEASHESPQVLACYQEALRRMTTPGGAPPPVDAVAAVATGLLMEQLSTGLSEQAVRTFEGLAPEVRARLVEGVNGQVDTEVQGIPFSDTVLDLRLDLAAAFLLEGDTATAQELIGSFDAKSDGIRLGPPPDPSLTRVRSALPRQVLARWMSPPEEDPFSLFTGLVGEANFGCSSEGAVFEVLVARLAEREGYPAVAGYFLDMAADCHSFLVGQEVESAAGPPGLADTLRAVEAELTAVQQSFDDELHAVARGDGGSRGPDPAAATISRLLHAPSRTRFEERHLPQGMAPVKRLVELPVKRRIALARKIATPKDFAAARVESDGAGRVAAIGVSQDYDPIGEISPGAYWVVLSSDGGKTWGRPLYTGLRVNQPYVVRELSALPLFDGDRLTIEVEVLELDTAVIFFPPVGLAPKRTEKGLYLEIPLAALQQDTDGDGLTDLAEERLLLDPEAADTDGDGLSDGADPLPTVPRGTRSAPTARALAALLPQISSLKKLALVEGVAEDEEEGGEPGRLCCASFGAPIGQEDTVFLIGDRTLFQGLQSDRRVLVLTEEESEAAREKFGPFFPSSLTLFFDRSGHRGYVVWSASWTGGQVSLDEKDGAWTATSHGSWIT